MKKIKAVVFDWGGVLAKNIFQDIMVYASEVLGVSKDELIPIFDAHHHKFMIGQISEKDFWQEICAQLGVRPPVSKSLIKEAFEQVYEPKEKVLSLLKELQKTNILTGLLSDAEKPSIKYFYEHKHPLFDAVVFSGMVGTEKPERAIYELLTAELGTKPEEVIFFDDRDDNIQAAKEYGINAHKVTKAVEIRKILQNYNVL